MFQKFFFCVLVFFCWQIGQAQQIVFVSPENHGLRALFGQRFTELYSGYAVLNARGTFMDKQVRKINIYNKSDSLLYFFELDKKGKTIEEGYQGNYYFRTLRRKVEYLDTFECRIWRKGNLIMRKDTYEIYHKVYRNADTLMEFEEYNFIVYKRGNLINEQNNFYSSQYLNHPGSFKDTYDSTILYLCSRDYYRANFTASVKNKEINVDTSSIREHSFFKKYRHPGLWKQFVEGEEFIEPLEEMRGSDTEDHKSEPYQTLNENGLFEKQFYDKSESTLMFYAKYEYYK